MAEYTDADVPLFLVGEIREQVDALQDPRFGRADGWVHTREWLRETDAGEPPRWQVIVRDDGTDDIELGVGSASIGVSVLAGSKQDPSPADDLARFVKRIVRATPRVEPGNPVAAVTSLRGPWPVEEPTTYARRYMTCELTVVGDPS